MPDFVDYLKLIAGEGGVITAAAERTPYERDWRGLVQNPSLAVALPQNTIQVVEIVKLCAAHKIAIVPQGGNTGLVAGAVPVPDRAQIILGFSRMNRIKNIDNKGNYIIVEAGVTLAAVQEAAISVNRLFPVSFAAQGSAHIGGVVSTNAGGMQVLAYGNMRAQVLGLEVVLADGRIWSGLSPLHKDNTGYDLKQMFIGAEGTLGLITAACLRLHPAPQTQAMALVGVADAQAAISLYQATREIFANTLTLFEFMEEAALGLAGKPPFAAPAYVLLEISASAAAAQMEDFLAPTQQNGLVLDAAIAASLAARQKLMALRENIPAGELAAGGALKHDIAVPLGQVAPMVAAAHTALAQAHPDCRLNIFGHLGDGNLHINIRPAAGQSLADLAPRQAAMTRMIEDLALRYGGSFSAEHGIGQLRLASMAAHKSPQALSMMRAVKQALDPDGIFNPGKLLPSAC